MRPGILAQRGVACLLTQTTRMRTVVPRMNYLLHLNNIRGFLMATNLRPVLFVAVGAMLLTTSAFSQAAPASAGKTDTSSGLEEVMVTAQRKEESLERTPVAISVVTADELVQRGVVSEQDLPSVAPGLGVRAALSSDQLTYAIRGGSLDPFSNSRPSVLPYFNEVQIGGAGSASAFYDLQSVQALKGPQGTLFGRNSTGGAVLFTSQKPTEQFGGYVSGSIGNLSDVKLEGAIGGAIVPGQLLVRLAGLYQKRDGFQLNLFDGKRLGAVDRTAVRGSLTFKPTETIKDDLVVDYYKNTGASVGPLSYSAVPGAGALPLGSIYNPLGFGPTLIAFGFPPAFVPPNAWALFLAAHPKVNPAGFAAEIAAQQARGPFVVNGEAPSYTEVKNLIVTNATSFDLGGDSQIKNILGYTNLDTIRGVDLDGTPVPIDSQGPRSGKGLHSVSKQLSEELQLLGKALDGKLSYVTGLYYADEKISYNTTSYFLGFEPFAPAGPTRNWSNTTNTSYAVYAQGTYDLSESTGVHGLGATAGLRYSDDKTRIQYLPNDTSYFHAAGTPPIPPDPAYSNDQTVSTKKPSWTLGLQDQVNPNLLLYAATRGSFKSAGFNYSTAPKIGDGSAGGNGYKTENVMDVELGMKLQSNANGMPVRLNLAAYNNWIRDRQATAYGNVGGPAALTVNVPQAKVYGLEGDGQIGLTHWLTVGGSANYTHAAYTAGHNVVVFGGIPIPYTTYPDTPEYSGSVFADVKIPAGADLEVSLHGDLSVQSDAFFTSTGAAGQNPSARIPGYGLANFRLGIGNSNADWSVSASVKNAFNKVYYVGGLPLVALFGFNTAVVGEPRVYTLDARYKF